MEVKKLSFTGPDFEITVSLKRVSEKFAKNQPGETPEELLNPIAQALLRSSEIDNKKIVRPMKLEEHSIEDSQGGFLNATFL